MKIKFKKLSEKDLGILLINVGIIMVLIFVIVRQEILNNKLNSMILEGTTKEENLYDSFASCLSKKGFVMYGSQRCGYCANQKEMFGESFNLINYVECTEQQELCREKKILGVPTWIYPDGVISGVQSLEELSELSNCEL